VRLATLLIAIAILALTSCASAGSSERFASPTEESPVDRTPSASHTPSSSLQLGSHQPSRAPAAGDDLIGTLGADSVEGGCGYLQAEDGTRYQVLYPDGWRLQLSPLQLISPEGDVVARGGDRVTVRGSVASDIASICMIGPMFRASDVVSAQ